MLSHLSRVLYPLAQVSAQRTSCVHPFAVRMPFPRTPLKEGAVPPVLQVRHLAGDHLELG